MASQSVIRRIAESVLTDLLEHEFLPAIEVSDVAELPTTDIVERLLLLAEDVRLRRSRTVGDVIELTFRLDVPARPTPPARE